MKDAARLLTYLVATLLAGALLAPLLYWAAQDLAAHHVATFLARYEFEKYFHRALLITALVLLWPLLRSLHIRSLRELQIASNPHALRDLIGGIALAALLLLCVAIALLLSGRFALRNGPHLSAFVSLILASIVVPILEEILFRGLILGVLLRAASRWLAVLLTSALFSIIHFLKTPEHRQTLIIWRSGFLSLADSFAQFHQPILVLAGFTTLFLLGIILADARIRTRSLWLPIGLHAGWIFAAGLVAKITRRHLIDLPWLGNNLLIGLIPLGLALLTWWLLHLWLKHETARAH